MITLAFSLFMNKQGTNLFRWLPQQCMFVTLLFNSALQAGTKCLKICSLISQYCLAYQLFKEQAAAHSSLIDRHVFDSFEFIE